MNIGELKRFLDKCPYDTNILINNLTGYKLLQKPKIIKMIKAPEISFFGPSHFPRGWDQWYPNMGGIPIKYLVF